MNSSEKSLAAQKLLDPARGRGAPAPRRAPAAARPREFQGLAQALDLLQQHLQGLLLLHVLEDPFLLLLHVGLPFLCPVLGEIAGHLHALPREHAEEPAQADAAVGEDPGILAVGALHLFDRFPVGARLDGEVLHSLCFSRPPTPTPPRLPLRAGSPQGLDGDVGGHLEAGDDGQVRDLPQRARLHQRPRRLGAQDDLVVALLLDRLDRVGQGGDPLPVQRRVQARDDPAVRLHPRVDDLLLQRRLDREHLQRLLLVAVLEADLPPEGLAHLLDQEADVLGDRAVVGEGLQDGHHVAHGDPLGEQALEDLLDLARRRGPSSPPPPPRGSRS